MSTLLADLETELVNRPRDTVIVVGAGVSMAVTGGDSRAGWTGLIRNGLDWCRDRYTTIKAEILTSYGTLIDGGMLIPVAEFVSEQMQNAHAGEYDQWLVSAIGGLPLASTAVINAISALGVPIATTNYDDLIERVSGRGWLTWRDPGNMHRFFRGETNDILHIHGHYSRPETVILGAKSYEEICRDEETQCILQAMLTGRTVVFIGCGAGLDDPNFGSLLRWSKPALRRSPCASYRLVRESEMSEVSKECDGLRIRPISYGKGYADLAPFLEGLATRVRERKAASSPLGALTRDQTAFETQSALLESRRGSLTPVEYCQFRLKLLGALWDGGGRRRAALGVGSLLMTQEGKALPRELRLPIELVAVQMLLDDDLARTAVTHLQEAQKILAEGHGSAEERARFHGLHLRCMHDLCAYSETLAAVDVALPSANEEERRRLEALRAEVFLLQGKIAAVLAPVQERATE